LWCIWGHTLWEEEGEEEEEEEEEKRRSETSTTFLVYKSDTVNELPVHNFIFQHSHRHCPNIY
jgi:hypothetical protein